MNNNHQTAVKATYFSIATNIVLAAVKALAGVFGNSYALIADAIESTTDIFSSFLVLFGLKYTNRPPDKNHPYGHGRAEPLITFIVVGFLIISAVVIAYESIINVTTPHEPPKPWTLIFLGGLIIWKEISFRIVMRKALQSNSSALKADAWHHRSDAITSVAAFLGIAIAVIFGDGYETADDWAALFASGFILYNAYKIFRPALGEIMDEHLYDDVIANIRKVAKEVDGIVATEKCYVRKAGMQYHVDLHAVVDGNITVRHGHELAHNLQDGLRIEFPEFGNVLIHIEPDTL
ncbi:cation transporter [Flavobacterium salilacus subsp. salilacus]|uniref:cation diffusion facilitator family transporter n=1 Tax=Flavobacterium TaxID=237 RepID=UPI001075473A|nr:MULTISPECIES: cation diffusion facilitator family transporter [Flavobacterium]KAF2518327.1 cation transporter [Flavobacterium salilacus subsp. salilacus]MBE1615258.1 cation transporter [Flavobacterium sp. SaA2.13]